MAGLAECCGRTVSCLQKGLDLLTGNEDFPQDFAGGKIPPLDEPSDCFCAGIEGGSRLFDVVKQRFRQRLFSVIFIHNFFAFVSVAGFVRLREFSPDARFLPIGGVFRMVGTRFRMVGNLLGNS